jgi:outer membrane protein TolC
MEYLAAGANLGAYVWSDEGEPMILSQSTTPTISVDNDPVYSREIEDFVPDSLVVNHPELALGQFEIDLLEVERRLKREQLKPVVDLKYNAIAEPINGNPFTEYSVNNYTWGLAFKMPLLLRKERGEVRLADLKIEESVNKLENKQASLLAKSREAIVTWQQTLEQIQLYTRTVNDYGDLLTAERVMFDAGESSLFMVNAREVGFINSQIQLIKLEKQLRKADLQIEYALGRLQ